MCLTILAETCCVAPPPFGQGPLPITFRRMQHSFGMPNKKKPEHVTKLTQPALRAASENRSIVAREASLAVSVALTVFSTDFNHAS